MKGEWRKRGEENSRRNERDAKNYVRQNGYKEKRNKHLWKRKDKTIHKMRE